MRNLNPWRRAAAGGLLPILLAAAATASPTPARDANLNPPNTDPVSVSSDEGAFQAVFPVGCSKLNIRTNEPAFGQDVDPADIVYVTRYACDRFGEKGAGCSVSSILGMKAKDGRDVGMDKVVEEMGAVLKSFGAVVEHERTIAKDLGQRGRIEGVEALARESAGAGQLWIRGLLYYGDIYVVVAWDQDGGVWENADYQAFFDSFLPYAKEP